MKHNIQARLDERSPAPKPTLRLVESQPAAAAGALQLIIVPVHELESPAEQPRGRLRALWKRWFGPPEIDVRGARSDFGVFRAMYEIGSDYLPASGTWPTR